MYFRLATLFAFALLALPSGAAGVYKCTNADGKTYYADQACPKSETAEKLRVPRAATNDDAGDTTTTRKSLDQRIAEATDPVVKAQLEIEKQRCELARTQIQRYEDAPYLVRKNEDGTEHRLSDEETRAEKDKLRRQIEERC